MFMWKYSQLYTFQTKVDRLNVSEVVCGYWVEDPLPITKNLTGQPCETVGMTADVYRREPWDTKNYYCCAHKEGYNDIHCYLIENVTEVLKCECMEMEI